MPEPAKYQWDIFLSYSHSDDIIHLGDPLPWVEKFAGDLVREVAQRLGSEVRLFRDEADGSAKLTVNELTALAGVSAIYLGLGSPSYNLSPYIAQEREAFIDRHGSGRVFIAEISPVEEAAYHGTIRDKVRRLFHRKRGGVSMTVNTAFEPMTYRYELARLATELARELEAMTDAPFMHKRRQREAAMRPRRVPAVEPPSVSGGATQGPAQAGSEPPQQAADQPPIAAVLQERGESKSVLIAYAPGLTDEARQVASHLGQMGVKVLPPPEFGHTPNPQRFKEDFAEYVTTAQVFVQLLGLDPGKEEPEFPDGRPAYQHQVARKAGLKILQWRSAAAKPQLATDPTQAALLSGDEVVVDTLTNFVREHVLRELEPPPPDPDADADWVFISHDVADEAFAKKVAITCSQMGLPAFRSLVPSTPSNRSYLQQQYATAPRIVVLYGAAAPQWAAAQLYQYVRARDWKKRPPKALVLCFGPPPEGRQDLPLELPLLERQYHDGKDWEPDLILERLFDGRNGASHVRH